MLICYNNIYLSSNCVERLRGDCLAKIKDLKIENIDKVKECFYNTQIRTKNELSLKTGISKAGITNILKILLKKQLISYIGEAHSTGGRKSKQYQINKDYCHIGKIILQRKKEIYNINVQSVDLFNQSIYENQLISQVGSYQELVEMISTLLNNDHLINVLCLSIPGICENGYISDCDFEKLRHIDLKEQFTQRYHKKIMIENDVNVAAIGLHHLLSIPHLALLYQPAVEYIGCGLIIAHHLYNGFSHFAGELRYLPFYDHQIQDEMLRNQPQELLRLQIETICCVVNPEMICLCSDVLNKEDMSTIQFHLPLQHIPKIHVLDSLDMYLDEGLYDIAINIQKEDNDVY